MEPWSEFNVLEEDSESLFIAIYLLVCSALEQIEAIYGPLRRSLNTTKPRFSDGELLTCVIVGELRQLNSERAWHRELGTTYRYLFPELLSWSQYKRRAAASGQVIELFRRLLVHRTCADHAPERMVDGKSVELAHIIRARGNLNKRFRPNILLDKRDGKPGNVWRIKPDAGHADIGYCASKKEYIFGTKLHMTCSLERVPMVWTLTPMTGSEREALYELIEQDPLVLRGGWLNVFGDKGYVAASMAEELWEGGGHDLQAIPKRNSKQPWPKHVSRMVSSARQGIETCFAEADRYFGLARFRPASLKGLLARMAAKITALTLRSIQHLIPALIAGKI